MSYKFKSGKYQGMTVEEVSQWDGSYLEYLFQTADFHKRKDEMAKEIRDILRLDPWAVQKG